jgi:signal transduction histidine kinase
VEKELENAKEGFFHMITHDMRAPLTSIMGYANMLRPILPEGPDADKCLKAILNGAARLNGMVQDILNTMKLERGGMEIGRERLKARELCARVLEAQGPLAARKKISLNSRCQDAVSLAGDAGMLDRVLTNLVGNALKFTPAGGEVTLSCSSSGGEAVVTVEDTGPGIPADKLSKIFEKHAQLDEHRNMGFGLGLAMCKLAVEAHGGRIWAESEEGKGSRFIFSIPAGTGGTD